jgi:hypothetical protein
MYIPGIPLFDNEEDALDLLITISPMEDRAAIDTIGDGDLSSDGKNLLSMTDTPMLIRIIRSFLCDGSKNVYARTLAEPLFCDDSFVCDDGSWPCAEFIEEEVL